MPLTDAGLDALRTEDFITEIRAAYISEAQLPEGTNIDDDVLLGIFVAVIAARLDSVSQGEQAVYDAFSEGNASGAQLDNINAIRGVRRLAGVKSRVPGTLSGTNGAVIAEGVIVQGGGDDGAARWVSLESVTISGGTASVTFEAEEVGATTVDAGTANIVTPRAGLDSATFGSPVSVGSATESDGDFRLRGAQSVAAPGAHTPSALVAALLALDGITDVLVLDNPDTIPQTLNGVLVPAHRHIVYILPNPLSSERETAVLNALTANLHFSTATGATDVTRVNTVPNNNTQYTVGFDYGTLVSVDVVATLSLESNTALADADASLETALNAYLTGLQLGESVRLLQLCNLAADIDGIIGATFTINGSAADLIINANQKASFGSLTSGLAP